MGFNTFESLQNYELPKRQNLVVTRKSKEFLRKYKLKNTKFFSSLDDALKYCDYNV